MRNFLLMLWRTMECVLFLILISAGCDGWNMDRMAIKFYPEPALTPSEIFVIIRPNQVVVTGIGNDRKLNVYYAGTHLRCTTGEGGIIISTNRIPHLRISNR